MSHAGLVNGAFLTMGTALLATSALGARRRRPATPARTAGTISLGTLGVSFLVQSPAAREVQNLVAANLGQLTGNATTLIAAYAMQVMMLHIRYEPAEATARARRWLAVLAIAIIGLVVLYLRTPTVTGKFTSPTAPAGVVAYYVIFTGYLAVTLTVMMTLLRRHAAHTRDRWLRGSLRLYGWACATGMIYLVGRLGALVVGRVSPGALESGERFGLAEFIVAAVIPGASLLLFLAAVVLRVGGRRWHYRRAIRRLRPLWESVRDARPHAVLPVPARRGNTRLRLYRQVIEIQDAQLAALYRIDDTLSQRIDEAVRAAGLHGDTARATRAAAILAAGLAALRDDPGGAPARDAAVDAGDAADLASVVTWLEQVSAAYTGPVARRFAAPVPEPR